MQSDRVRRRALYWLSGAMWGVSGGLVVHTIATESLTSRAVLLLTTGLACCLTTGSLFAVFVAPLERVYRHGYEAGQRSSVWREPDQLRAVPGQQAQRRPVVVPINVVRRDFIGRS